MRQTNPADRGTAIVTGASSGIGKVYAEKLAARGYDLVLVARRKDRLHQIAADLQKRFAVRTEVLAADLSQSAGLAVTLERIARDASLSLLVNNAGYSILKPVSETTLEQFSNMIALNITALTALCKAALAQFQAKGSGTIVNIGSGVGFAPLPMVPIYGPTKAYVLQFTQILQQQTAGTGIRVQLVTPGAVVSEGWEVAGGADLAPLDPSVIMTTEDCVEAALTGLDRGETITAPSLEDASLLRSFEDISGALLQGMFRSVPATRYGLRT